MPINSGTGTPRPSPLFDPGPAAVETLTANQRAVLEAIPVAGITARQAGVLVYGDRAEAASFGRSILQALKSKGLVRERRNPARYELVGRPPGPTDDIPY